MPWSEQWLSSVISVLQATCTYTSQPVTYISTDRRNPQKGEGLKIGKGCVCSVEEDEYVRTLASVWNSAACHDPFPCLALEARLIKAGSAVSLKRSPCLFYWIFFWWDIQTFICWRFTLVGSCAFLGFYKQEVVVLDHNPIHHSITHCAWEWHASHQPN